MTPHVFYMEGTRAHDERCMMYQTGYREGSRMRVYKDVKEINLDLPFFRIESTPDENKKFNIKIGNYAHHDNASRMLYFARYIDQKVLPYMSSEEMSKLDGYYNIELHDSYSYLKGDHEKYKNCLVWSKKKGDHEPILLPDIYHLANYGNKLEEQKDTLRWDEKMDKVGFWGTTTGDRDPRLNERINKCFWFHRVDPRHEVSDCYITRVAQMSNQQIVDAFSDFHLVFQKYASFEEQCRYKILIDIPGNTCSWDRVPVILSSNSLLFRFPCTDVCSYYHLMKEYVHYVPVTEKTVLERRMYYLQHPEEAQIIIKNAQSLAKDLCNGRSAQRYMKGLFRGISGVKEKKDEER